MIHHGPCLPGLARSFGALVLSLALAGCASFQGGPEWSTAKTLAEADALYATYLARYYRSATPATRADVRNQFIEVRAGLIDRNYAGFKQTLYAQRVGSAVGLDISTLALNAIGAGVGDVGVKTATSALSAGLIGSKASIDKNVYFDRTLPALLAQMDGMRSELRARLLAGMLVDADRYPLMQAAADLDEYFHAGTIPGAISAITSQAGQSKAAAEAKLTARLPSEAQITRELQKKGFHVAKAVSTDTTKQIERCIDPATDDLPPDLKLALVTWLGTQGLDTSSKEALLLTDFMTSPDAEDLRKNALVAPELRPLFDRCPK